MLKSNLQEAVHSVKFKNFKIKAWCITFNTNEQVFVHARDRDSAIDKAYSFACAWADEPFRVLAVKSVDKVITQSMFVDAFA